MSWWKRLRHRFTGPKPDEFALEGNRLVFRTAARARTLDVKGAGWGPTEVEACGSCGGSLRQMVFTTAGLGEAQRAVFREVPLAVDGWMCSACGWSTAPRRVSPEEITSFIQEGARHGQADQLDDAEYWFLRAVSSWPDYPPALGNLAEVRRLQARSAAPTQRAALLDDARNLMRRAVDNDAGIAVPPHYVIELARMEALSGNESSALTRLRELTTDAETPHAVAEEARALAEMVRSGRALFTRASDIARSLIITQGEASHESSRPLDAKQRADLSEARSLLESALQRDARAYATHWMLGKVHQRLGDEGASIESFARAYELNPDQPDVCREYVLALLNANRATDALPVAEHACELKAEDAGLRCNLAVTLLLAGKVGDASRAVERALQLDPTDDISRRLSRVIERVRQGARAPQSLAELEGRA